MKSILPEIKALGKQSLVYGAGLWATSAGGFILVPLYVRRLSPHDYGLLEMLNRTCDIVRGFALAGMVVAVLRLYHLGESQEERNRVVSSAVAFVLSISLAIQVGITLFSPQVSRWLLGSPEYAALCVLAGLRMVTDIGYLLPGTLLRVREQVLLYTAFSVARFVLSIAFNIWFVVGMDRGLLGVMEANVVSGALVALAVTAYCFRAVGVAVSGRTLRAMLHFGLPVAMASIPAMITGNLDRYLLLNLRSASELGIYALASRFGTLLSVVLFEPFIFVYAAFMFKIENRSDAGQVYGKLTTMVTAAAVWVTVALATFAPDIVAVVSHDQAYARSGAVAPILLVGALLFGISPMFEVGIYLRKKTIWKPAIITAQAGAFGLLCWLLIPRWGAVGAAWAFVGQEVVLCLGLYLASQRLFRISYEWPRLGLLLAALGAGVFLGVRPAGDPSELSLVSRMLLVVALAPAVAAAALLRSSGLPRPTRATGLAAGLSRRLKDSALTAARPLLRGIWTLSPGVLILRYHSVSDPADPDNPLPAAICTSPEAFDAQMARLAAEASPVALDAVMAAFESGTRLPARPVVVTFDDGFADNYEAALPILLAHRVPAAFFLCTGWIGNDTEPWFVAIRRAFLTTRRPSWVSPSSPGREFPLDSEPNRHQARREAARILARLRLGEQQAWIARLCHELDVDQPDGQSRLMMSWEQVSRLREAGMTVGAHTVAHVNLAWLPRAAQQAELCESKLALEAHLRSAVKHLSYPSPIDPPCFNRESLALAQATGFRSALTTNPGLASVTSDRFALPRMPPPVVNGSAAAFSHCFLRAALRTT